VRIPDIPAQSGRIAGQQFALRGSHQ